MKNKWTSVAYGLPKPETPVLITTEYFNWGNGKKYRRVDVAIYEDGYVFGEDSKFVWWDNDFERVEELDDFVIPRGWFESNQYSEVFAEITDKVVAWMPLPERYQGF